MSSLRVMLVHEDTRAPGQGGGAESLLRDQTEALRRLGHTVAWLQSEHIQQAVDEFRPDVVQLLTIHNFLPGWQRMARWLQEQHIPHVWALADYWPFCRGRMLLVDWIDGPGCSAVAGVCEQECLSGKAPPEWRGRSPADWLETVNGSPVVALNAHTAAIYQRNGVRCDHVVELGVDTEMFRPDPAKRNGQAAIYTSSAWPEYPVKGMPILKAAIAGTPYQANLIAHQSRENVAEGLKRADVYVFPSTYQETWGLSLCEAMASGCACVASDVAGARAQVEHGETGLLVPPRDPVALRDALDWLMGDGDLRRRLGQAARAHVEAEHSLEAMGRRWEGVYGAVLEPQHTLELAVVGTG